MVLPQPSNHSARLAHDNTRASPAPFQHAANGNLMVGPDVVVTGIPCGPRSDNLARDDQFGLIGQLLESEAGDTGRADGRCQYRK